MLRVKHKMALQIPTLVPELVFKEKEVILPTLFKQATTGKTLVWNIKLQLINGNGNPIKIKKIQFNQKLKPEFSTRITVTHGQLDGKMQDAVQKITKGKNIGRSNETNVLTQGLSEMGSVWTKQQDRRNYTAQQTKISTPSIRPMLLHEYTKNKSKIKFPACQQVKADGVRALTHYDPKEQRFRFYSRTGKEYYHLDHIRADLEKIDYLIEHPNVYLDGEMYSEEVNFNNIVGICKKCLDLKSSEAKKQKFINYYVFDLFDLDNPNMPFSERIALVEKLLKPKKITHLVPLLCKIVKTPQDIQKQHVENSKEWEGSVIRNLDGLYELGRRSYNALKLKDFITEEFPIVGFKEGTGKEEGLIIFELETDKGKRFWARPEGSHEERAELFKIANDLIGKEITVRFVEYTPDGIPRFPVALNIRSEIE